MKAVVIQKFYWDLDGIRKSVVNLGGKTEIVYTSDPEKVLQEAAGTDPVFIVSGVVFEGHRAIRSGIQLARAVKSFNPNALFFIYSMELVEKWDLIVSDGIIPKDSDGEYSLVAKILASNLEGITPADLGRAFPEITIIPHGPRPFMPVRVEKNF